MADTIAPVLTSLNLPATIYLDGVDRAVPLSVGAGDTNGTGVTAVQVWLSRPVTHFEADSQTWVSDTLNFDGMLDPFSDGRSTLQWNLSRSSEPGPYGILSVYVVDAAGNERTYLPADLKAVGIRTSFTISTFDLVTTGDKGRNMVQGGSGHDKLNGGLGIDTLIGGPGKDAFVFNTKPSKTNRDKITDFNSKDDSIWLDNAVFKKLGPGMDAAPVQLKKGFFTIGSKAKDRDDYVIYNKKTGVLSYDADGSGKGKAVEFAQLKKGLSLKYDDLFVI
ncbi:M10 family metallopeptidase C-terminal domain-containing protein [Microvirga soli]|uniref:M10 family metallopeptidase C-terminal domain-containing protein n=1 Tax=Microvirga soli TaxID=1854496 RepID=UPI00191DD51A|nr:calcium-binding protein [Microvirga soli]